MLTDARDCGSEFYLDVSATVVYRNRFDPVMALIFAARCLLGRGAFPPNYRGVSWSVIISVTPGRLVNIVNIHYTVTK